MNLRANRLFAVLFLLVVSSLVSPAVFSQKKSKKSRPAGKPVLWEKVNVGKQNLFLGPGGSAMRPNLKRVTLIKEEKGGSSKKYRIKDASGREWVAKIDKESQSETAAVRLLSALGYKTEINYLAPKLTIPGKGTFANVRLEARPKNIERLERWKWDENPFKGSIEFQGLKVMMALLNNWDLKDGNTIILRQGGKHHYTISDLGATFGKYGSNNLPVVWRIGRSKNEPEGYSETDFIKGVEEGEIDFAYKGKNSGLFDGITVDQARWIAGLLGQLSDRQIGDAFRAANYSRNERRILTQAVKNRIAELSRAAGQNTAVK